MVLVLKPAKGTGGRRRRDRRSLRIEFVNFNASCCCKFGYKAVTRIVFTENLMIIPATKANYKDDINKDFKPDDGDADPGVAMSSIIASWKVCGTLHGNCKLHRGAGGVIISQQNKNRCFLVCDRILPFRDCRCE